MAEQRVLFISERFVKSNSEIDSNVSSTLIRPTVWYCQKEYIERSLGTELYNDLIAKTLLDRTLATYPNYLALVNGYLADALLFWVRHEIQVPLLYKFRNKSVGKNTDPNQQPVDHSEHLYLKSYYKNKAEYFTGRMEKYLCANSTLFPLWLDCSTEGIDAKKTDPTISLYLP